VPKRAAFTPDPATGAPLVRKGGHIAAQFPVQLGVPLPGGGVLVGLGVIVPVGVGVRLGVGTAVPGVAVAGTRTSRITRYRERPAPSVRYVPSGLVAVMSVAGPAGVAVGPGVPVAAGVPPGVGVPDAGVTVPEGVAVDGPGVGVAFVVHAARAKAASSVLMTSANRRMLKVLLAL
jgi:hypothetical protein